MKKSRFAETRIARILKEAESGIADILHMHGNSDNYLLQVAIEYGALEASELKRVKEL